MIYPNCSTARLYEAAVRAAIDLRFRIVGQDPASGTVTFWTTVPTTAWRGPEMSARVIPKGDSAQVVIRGTRVAGYRLALADWLETKRIGLLFLQRVSSVLPAIAEPTPPATANRSPVADLKSLADLREQGLLTEDEFEAEKKRLLS